MDLYTPVTPAYAKGENTFTGTIKQVELKVGLAGRAVPPASLD